MNVNNLEKRNIETSQNEIVNNSFGISCIRFDESEKRKEEREKKARRKNRYIYDYDCLLGLLVLFGIDITLRKPERRRVQKNILLHIKFMKLN